MPAGLLAPRLVAANAVQPGVGDDVVHDIQARGTAQDEVLRVDLKDVGHEATGGGDAIGSTVVGGVDHLVGEVGRGGEHVEHRTGEVLLLGARLAAGHVEREVAEAQGLDLCLELRDLGIELLVGHALRYVGHRCLLGTGPHTRTFEYSFVRAGAGFGRMTMRVGWIGGSRWTDLWVARRENPLSTCPTTSTTGSTRRRTTTASPWPQAAASNHTLVTAGGPRTARGASSRQEGFAKPRPQTMPRSHAPSRREAPPRTPTGWNPPRPCPIAAEGATRPRYRHSGRLLLL